MRQHAVMTDPTALWNFDDPAGSEQRFRTAADTAEGTDRLVLMTQVARALGLQERYDEGHAVLDHLAADDAEVATRVSLERGRLLRSGGEPDEARPHFAAAAATAADAGLEVLHVDALHMVALVAPAEDQQRLTEEALAVARAASSRRPATGTPRCSTTSAWCTRTTEDWPAALATFEEALAARERIGDVGTVRVARWMVGWALRNLGRTDEALAVQRSLKAELDGRG